MPLAAGLEVLQICSNLIDQAFRSRTWHARPAIRSSRPTGCRSARPAGAAASSQRLRRFSSRVEAELLPRVSSIAPGRGFAQLFPVMSNSRRFPAEFSPDSPREGDLRWSCSRRGACLRLLDEAGMNPTADIDVGVGRGAAQERRRRPCPDNRWSSTSPLAAPAFHRVHSSSGVNHGPGGSRCARDRLVSSSSRHLGPWRSG